MSDEQRGVVLEDVKPTGATETVADSTRPAVDVRTMTYVAVSVALAAALNFVPLFEMPQGGSVALDMVPIIFLSFYRGVKPGILAGALYGFVNLALEPFIVHPAQVVLDYPLAFGLVGLAGVTGFGGPIAVGIGAFIGGSLRFMSHFFSGVIFFAEYAPEGQSPWLYSAIYNGSYMSVSILLAIPVVYTLLKAMNREGERTAN